MNQQPISESKPMGPIGRVLFGLLGIALIAGGVLGLWFVFLKPTLNVVQAQSWPTAECTVVSSRVERHDDSDGDTFSAEVTFKYLVDNKEYRSDTYSFYDFSGPRGSAKKTCDKYPKGSKQTCYYNPADPGKAVLDPSFGWFSLFALLFLLLPLIGLAMLYYMLFPSKRKQHAPNQFASGDGQVYQKEDDTASIFTSELQGPQKLKPEQGRLGGLIITSVLLAIFGGVAFYLYKADGISIFFVIMGLIALATLAGTVYQALAMTNPVVEVALSNGTLVPGETVDVAWETTGNHTRFRTLTIAVDVEETAEYTRGTDRVTDRETAFTEVLATIVDKQEMQFGSTTFTVPRDAVHSFKSSNNTVTWRIKVLGDIPMWPDVSEEFKFMVQPNE